MATESPILVEARSTFERILTTLEAKGKDYATDADIFQNFRLSETLIGLNVPKAVIVRLLDKVSRICNLVEKDADVKSEPIEDTLDDLIGYAILLKVAIAYEKALKNPFGKVTAFNAPTFVGSMREDFPTDGTVISDLKSLNGTIGVTGIADERLDEALDNLTPKMTYDDPMWAGEETGLVD